LTAKISVLQCTLTYIHIWTYLILCTILSLYIWLKTEADLSKQRMYAWKATTWKHFYIDKITSIWLFELIPPFNTCIVSIYSGRVLRYWCLAEFRLWTRIGYITWEAWKLEKTWRLTKAKKQSNNNSAAINRYSVFMSFFEIRIQTQI